MATLKSKHKGYKYGVLKASKTNYNAGIRQLDPHATSHYDETDIISFEDISGLTLDQLYNNTGIVSSYGLIFVMYDSIPIIYKKTNWEKGGDYDVITKPSEVYIRIECQIIKNEFEEKGNEIIDNVIATKLIEHYKKGSLEPYNEERLLDFIERFFNQIPEERENNMINNEDNNYLFGLYIDPKINHEDSYLGGFRKASIPINLYLDFNEVKGRTIEEISYYSDHLKKDKYMYFLMLDKVPYTPRKSEIWNDSYGSWVARYYLEINIENNKEKLIEDCIKEAIEDEFSKEIIGGSFYKRGQVFLDKYIDKPKEDRGKDLIKSIFI